MVAYLILVIIHRSNSAEIRTRPGYLRVDVGLGTLSITTGVLAHSWVIFDIKNTYVSIILHSPEVLRDAVSCIRDLSRITMSTERLDRIGHILMSVDPTQSALKTSMYVWNQVGDIACSRGF